MLEQLNGLLNTTAEGAEAALEYAHSCGPWGRAAAMGVTMCVTAATTLYMMNKCRARSASNDLSQKDGLATLTPETLVNSETQSVEDSVKTSYSGSLSDSDSDSDFDNGDVNANHSRSRSKSPSQ